MAARDKGIPGDVCGSPVRRCCSRLKKAASYSARCGVRAWPLAALAAAGVPSYFSRLREATGVRKSWCRVDLVMLIMNHKGMPQLLLGKFELGVWLLDRLAAKVREY